MDAPRFILAFGYLAPFQNAGDPKGLVENREKFRTFSPVKLGDRWTKCVSQYFKFSQGTNLVLSTECRFAFREIS